MTAERRAMLFTALIILQISLGRAQLVDINQDGWLDLSVENRYYLRQPDSSFQEGPAGNPGASFTLWGDLNNDGKLDSIAIYRKGIHRIQINPLDPPNSTPNKPVIEQPHNTVSAALADLDRDGFLDLMLGNGYIQEGQSYDAEPMVIYRGPNFQAGPPYPAPPLYGITAADLDQDGYPEIIGAAYGRRWNTLWKRTADDPEYQECARDYGLDGDGIRHGRYPGEGRSDELPYRSNGNTFCLAPGDFDNDGDLDLFSAEITHAWAGDSSDLSALLVNQGDHFERQIEQVLDPETGFRARPTRGLHRDHTPQTPHKWNQGDLQAHWADLDNDGLLDLLICESDYPHNHLRIFRQKPDHTFYEAQAEFALDKFNNCAGAAVGDIDRDGDLDLVLTGTQTRWPQARAKPEMALWSNPCQKPSLTIKLIGGEGCNRNAIGARATLTTAAGKLSRWAQGPYGHWGQQSQPDEIHFGLDHTQPLHLSVTWPDAKGTVTTYDNLPSHGWLVIHQEQGILYSSPTFQAPNWAQPGPSKTSGPLSQPRQDSSPPAPNR